MTALRKKPVQERSRRRFEAILDAAADLFADQGLDAVTMEAIAAKADTSIGSLYQYFPDKQSLFVALAERVLDRSRAAFDALVPKGELPPWEQLIDRAVDGFGAMLADPSLRAVWMNLQLYGEVWEADAALTDEMIDRTAGIVHGYAPRMRSRERRRVATMIVEVIGAVIFTAFRRHRERQPEMMSELKLLLHRYLAPYVTSHGRAR